MILPSLMLWPLHTDAFQSQGAWKLNWTSSDKLFLCFLLSLCLPVWFTRLCAILKSINAVKTEYTYIVLGFIQNGATHNRSSAMFVTHAQVELSMRALSLCMPGPNVYLQCREFSALRKMEFLKRITAIRHKIKTTLYPKSAKWTA